MTRMVHVGLGLAALILAGQAAMGEDRAGRPPETAVEGCDDSEGLRFICDQRQPEDIAVVPGERWAFASQIGGGLALINTATLASAWAYPDAKVAHRVDAKRFPGCPGEPDAGQRAKFATAGLALRPGQGGIHLLYAGHFGWERGIDVFEVDASGSRPRLTWVGCIMSPPNVGVNSIAPIEDDGIAVTNWVHTGPGMAAEMAAMRKGAINGEVWEWKPGAGWTALPGSEGSGPNGILASADGQWYFVAHFGNRRIVRLSRAPGVKRIDWIPVDFSPDNLHWASDGGVLAGGGTPDGRATVIVKLDPRTLEVVRRIEIPSANGFMRGTGATEVGDRYWIPSVPSSRIAIILRP